jgi:RHS repeat-associated protein
MTTHPIAQFVPTANPSYYRARYYDAGRGRFISEDPLGFIGGVDFYSYVLNRPIQMSDPQGLSPQDVQRIRQICHSRVQEMVQSGVRRPGGGPGPLNGSGDGFLNDQTSNQSIYGLLKGSNYLGCKDQAYRAVGCLQNANAKTPFDAGWGFSAVAWWAGLHTIVRAKSSDPNDPIVYCDPWRDLGWTAPQNPPAEGWPRFSKF